MNDGGPAFPSGEWHKDTPPSSGLSLRDYFAAAAVNRLLAWDWTGPADSMSNFPHYAEQAAKTAYAIADAMLAEREKK